MVRTSHVSLFVLVWCVIVSPARAADAGSPDLSSPFPVGFYARFHPLSAEAVAQEARHGFNVVGPAIKLNADVTDQAIVDIRTWMDSCAQVGMKVNVPLVPLGVAPVSEAKRAAVKRVVTSLRDHPALLGWYVADEPKAEQLDAVADTCRMVKQLDTEHPTMLAVTPWWPTNTTGKLTAQQDAHITMCARAAELADVPMIVTYPIPQRPIHAVAEDIAHVRSRMKNRGAFWVVPQVFGGNEAWEREPTAAEVSAMTYLAVIHGTGGVQYFTRWPGSFPKSDGVWAACSRVAQELAYLTPALRSGEPQPRVDSHDKRIDAAAWRDRQSVYVLAVNTANQPLTLRLRLPEVHLTGTATLVFENREAAVTGGVVDDMIDGHGTRVYRIDVQPAPPTDVEPSADNGVVDPSFERMSSVGVPDACYLNSRRAHAAARVTVDGSMSKHGRHSLRVFAPVAERGIDVHPHWVRVRAGQRCEVSAWARGDREGTSFEMRVRGLPPKRFELSQQWRRYEVTGVVTASQSGPWGGEGGWSDQQITLRYLGPGTAWFDLLQVVPRPAEP